MKQYSGYVFIAIGAIIAIIIRLHHLIVNPHLTEAQALLYYWPLLLCAIAWGMFGLYINSKLEKK